MKLKCDKHDRRLMILGIGNWVHRTGDQSPCDSTSATIGDETVIRDQIPGVETEPARVLLHEIFAK